MSADSIPSDSVESDEPTQIQSEPSSFTMPDFKTYIQSLDPELRDQPSIQNIDSFQGLIREHANVQKFIGGDKIAKPAANAPKEDWDRFYGAMGRPDQPDKYDLSEFRTPENVLWDKEFQDRMVAHLHKHGASNQQVVGILKDYAADSAEQLQRAKTDAQVRQQEAHQSLEKEWGGAMDVNTELASRAFKKTFGDEFEQIANAVMPDGTPIGDHPVMLRAFYRLGREMREHGMVGDPSRSVAPVMTLSEAQQRLSQIENEPGFAAILADPNQASNPKRIEWNQLYDILAEG